MSTSLAAETGTVRKRWKGRVPVALLYPNTYALAVSNLGFQLVYSLLNLMDGLVCERFVYPDQRRSLRSLESSRPMTDFPLVFGSISFEHDYPRLAAMLAAGGIEPFAESRPKCIAPGSPLVVLGGVGVFINPEPLAAFADLMVLGEAEPVLSPLIEALLNWNTTPRQELLRQVVTSLPGCYAPIFYAFSYAGNGSVQSIQAAPGIPERVRRVYTAGVEQRAAHSSLHSPEAELDMFMVELGRGCGRGCRFCAAGFIYRPPRMWSSEAIMQSLEDRPAAVDRIGLLGMEMAQTDTIDRIAACLERGDCSLSFSSLRADRITTQTLSLLAGSRLKSAAIAADGCSERLRRLINKGLDEETLLTAAVRLVEAGIVHLKLYVMIGLPTETEADLDELIQLVGRLQTMILPVGRARGRVTELTLSINCFIPKPCTPFQYCSFGGMTAETGPEDTAFAVMAMKTKIRYLRRMLNTKANLRLKFDYPDQALQQAVFSRADRRIAPALLDIGTGRFSFKQALRHRRLDAWQYAIRQRLRDERMCWDLVDHGLRDGYLWEEYQKALAGAVTRPCEPLSCRRCGVCHADDPT
ncbi:radical SAM protein [Desulfobulbus alkaliphilus]|uniref:radical SAM protein n=1 Tax=Desulfobulbus alkaliphilus TaxID=869814 RepID=UPI0019635967|nr:radical SAM protein [Desulfobulbus alkaliphilus]MBM9536022.1 radical SAM protein [Desulfobulbus alkaliphilus]